MFALYLIGLLLTLACAGTVVVVWLAVSLGRTTVEQRTGDEPV